MVKAVRPGALVQWPSRDVTVTLYRVAHCRPETEHVRFDEEQVSEKPLGPVTVAV